MRNEYEVLTVGEKNCKSLFQLLRYGARPCPGELAQPLRYEASEYPGGPSLAIYSVPAPWASQVSLFTVFPPAQVSLPSLSVTKPLSALAQVSLPR